MLKKRFSFKYICKQRKCDHCFNILSAKKNSEPKLAAGEGTLLTQPLVLVQLTYKDNKATRMFLRQKSDVA
ncbi:TPA: hypothetical protein DCX24_07890 [Candidatus Azambacteria bacterium]|nr:hypothetical protein [Rheinheimera sp.]HAW92646.1 hypothetical protein [Candidatus Azambacteria bacterium]